MKDWAPEEIEHFRKSRGLTRREIAELTGVLTITVYKWERGLIRPSKTTKLLLSRIEEDFRRKKTRKEVYHGKENAGTL
jgi:DNA-binding transcriptional regulator YiaG